MGFHSMICHLAEYPILHPCIVDHLVIQAGSHLTAALYPLAHRFHTTWGRETRAVPAQVLEVCLPTLDSKVLPHLSFLVRLVVLMALVRTVLALGSVHHMVPWDPMVHHFTVLLPHSWSDGRCQSCQ